MRILHLIDAASAQSTSTTLAMLADAQGRLGDAGERVVLLGGSHLAEQARSAGVMDPVRIGVPMGRAVFALRALPRELRRRGERPFDVIHCWSVGALTLASLLLRATPRVLSMTVQPTSQQVRWLRLLTSETSIVGWHGQAAVRRGLPVADDHLRPHGQTAPGSGLPVPPGDSPHSAVACAILPISSTIRRDLLTGGVSEAAVHVLRPSIDMSRIAARGRASLREAWGIDPATDAKTIVVALPSDPPGAADAVAAMAACRFALETVQADGFDIRLLVHPFQRRRLQAKQMLRSIGGLRMLIDEPRLAQPWTVLSGCDIALALSTDGPVRVRGADARPVSSQRPPTKDIGHGYLGAGASAEAGGGGLSLLWAMAGNIPIVGEATYGISEIVEDRHSALLARPGQLRTLAHHLRQIITDKHLAWTLRDTARHEAYSYFSRTRYCASIRGVYGQMIAGRPVEVPAMESTGGLRFTGRG